MVTILICRFVSPDKEDAFMENYRAMQPVENKAFHGEKLMRVGNDAAVPTELKGFNAPDCITYLNIAEWDSWEAFYAQFEEQFKKPFDERFEVAPRQRAIIEPVEI